MTASKFISISFRDQEKLESHLGGLRHCVGRCTVQSSNAPRSRPRTSVPEESASCSCTRATNTRPPCTLFAARKPVLSARTSPRVFQRSLLIWRTRLLRAYRAICAIKKPFLSILSLENEIYVTADRLCKRQLCIC